jgi:hypothetical protein
LRITHQTDGRQATDFTFDVWSPFTGSYQNVGSLENALRRVTQLADLIAQMWQQKHARQGTLTDLPVVAATERSRPGDPHWAEFRINPANFRSYDTRRIDRTGWLRATDMVQAAEITCKAVGYPMAKFAMSHMLEKKSPVAPPLIATSPPAVSAAGANPAAAV